MAEAVMGPVLGRLQELATNEVGAMVAVNNDARSLRDRLMWMQAFLHDADPRRRAKNDELVRVCLQQTRDAVFEAEDAVDQYFLQVDLSRYPSYSRVILKFFTGFTTQVRVRHNLSRRIKSINTRLESIIANKDKYKINDSDDMSITTWRPSTNISATAEKLDGFKMPLMGRDDKLKKLKNALFERETEWPMISVIGRSGVEKLKKLKIALWRRETEHSDERKTRETKRPMVIFVTGKSGVGKTKLVKEIYEQHKTKNHFDVLAWVNFAPHLSASNILNLILVRLKEGGVTCPKCEVGQMLHEKLKTKKYLLVIDGEVNSMEWKTITTFLPTDKAESRVVRITPMTKSESPDANFGHYTIDLEDFENKNTTTKLFLEALLVHKESEKNKDDVWRAATDEHAEDIFEVTGGLPLAVVLLSGLLWTKEYPGEWNKVFEHLKGKSGYSKRLDSILSICFDDLPHDLKSCFLYFAAFPVNTLLKVRNLVCLWMAEGFLRPKEGMTLEKVGELYLSELAHRHLIDLPPLEYAAPGDERVTVQTGVHEFLVDEAQEAKFVDTHGFDDVEPILTARRLSLQNHRDKYVALADPLPKLRSCRSILSSVEKEEASNEGADETKKGKPDAQLNWACLACLHPRHSKDFIRKLLQGSEFLRVIKMDGFEVGDKLPSEIGNVVHLQYLGITSCSLREIPPSIGKLTRLQTLDVRSTNVKKLPREFWRIRTLRHVFGSLYFPKRVRHLEDLQTLAAIMPDKADAWDKKTLAHMKRLRSLYISGLSKENMPALKVTLNYLERLVISGKVISSDLFTRSNLPRLQFMSLRGEILPRFNLAGAHAPSSPPGRGSHRLGSHWFYLPNLTKLLLKKTKVSQDFIDELGELPILTTLALFRGSFKGTRLVFTRGFQNLKELTLELGVHLERVVIEKAAFPDVENIDILCYPNRFRVEIHNRHDIEKKTKSEDKSIFVYKQ